jgi:hypothetical protein
VSAFEKSPRGSDLNHEYSSLLIRRLNNNTNFHLQTIHTHEPGTNHRLHPFSKETNRTRNRCAQTRNEVFEQLTDAQTGKPPTTLVLRLKKPTAGFKVKPGETVATSFEARLEKTVATSFKVKPEKTVAANLRPNR